MHIYPDVVPLLAIDAIVLVLAIISCLFYLRYRETLYLVFTIVLAFILVPAIAFTVVLNWNLFGCCYFG
jgi:multisubunit Na+/H+ antiporter MnhF subunit